MKHLKPFNEDKPAGAPEFHHSSKKVPKADGRFRDLSIEDLAAWLIKTRDKDLKRISGSLTQQITFNKDDDPKYAEKMEKTRQEVYKQLGRKDLMDSKQIDNNMKYIKEFNEALFGNHSKKDYSDEMSYGQLERCIDYANMIRERIEAGTSLDAWMHSQIAVAENELNAVFGALDGDDGVVESDGDWNDKKPGPDAYTATLSDKDKKKKEAQMKKQAEMDDDDPDAYKEMPGSEEAREQGKVKTSKHVKSYHELYGDDEANEALISSDDQAYLDQITSFLKKYKDKRGLDSDKEFTAEVIKVLKQRVSDRDGLVKKRFQKILKSIQKDFKSGTYLKLNESTILEKSKVLKFKEWGIDNHVELKQLMDYLRDEDINWNQSGQSLKFDSVEDADKAKEWLGESILNEGVMNNLHQMAGEVKSEDEFVKKFFKEYGAKIKKSSDSIEWVKSLYQDTVEEGLTESIKVGGVVTIKKYNPITNRKESKDVRITDYIKKPGSNDFVEYELKGKKRKVSLNIFKSIMESINEKKEKKQSTDRTPLEDDAMETGLKNKAKETGVPIGIIRAVARRGLAAWKTGHRPGATQQQWAYARVNSFLTKQDGTWGGADSDLAKEVRDGGHDKKLKKA